jgi:hypothetical protein
MFHLPKHRVIGEEAGAFDSVPPASPASASAQASPAAPEAVQVLSESTISMPSHIEQVGGRTFFRLEPGACLAFNANKSLICCSSACFSALTWPSSPIALFTSVARTFLNSSMWTAGQYISS